MKTQLHPHEKAARVIRLMAWLCVLTLVAVGAAVGIPAASTGKPLHEVFHLLAAIGLAIPITLFLIARGLLAKRDWARWAGMAYALLALTGVPLGTIVGIYVLWQLQKGWPEIPAEQGTDPLAGEPAP